MENNEYVRARKKLIPEAERFANQVAGVTARMAKKEPWADEWNKAFHGKMEILCRTFGVTGAKTKPKTRKRRVKGGITV